MKKSPRGLFKFAKILYNIRKSAEEPIDAIRFCRLVPGFLGGAVAPIFSETAGKGMENAEMEILQGVITAVVFQNYENGYAVLRLNTGAREAVTVVGTIPAPAAGERLLVTGRWSTHPSFGRQFEAEFLERMLPQSAQEILAYLSGRVIKGIGPKTAAKIVQHFGDRTLQILEREPERLSEVPGITRAKAAAIGEEFRQKVGMRQLMEFFAQHQLPAELAVRTYKLYGESAADLLYADPYLLTDEALQAPFAAVDRFAIEIGTAANDPKRIRAGLLFELRYNLSAGHCFLPTEKLVAAAAQLLHIEEDAARSVAANCAAEQILSPAALAGIPVLYLPQLFQAETAITRRLLAAARLRFPEPQNLEQLLREVSRESEVEYSADQEAAVRMAAGSGILLITGGPGTGKTTVLRGILALFGRMQLACVLAAPTGRAAKRLAEVTGESASTIHRLLEAAIDPATGQMTFTRDESNPLKADAVIVDEMSMVDVPLLDALLRAIPAGKRLIFVGDPDQLPPVGPGYPFGDMLRSGEIPAVRLTEIFRQARESLIVMNAHRINRGELPQLHDRRSDFFFLGAPSEEAAARTVVDLVARRLPRNMHIPAEQIQVLSPTRRGTCGTAALNEALQAALNPPAPGKQERKFGAFTFREGDRVMQVKNNYDIVWKRTDSPAVGTGVFNGDVGTVAKIDNSAELLTVVFDDRAADYDFTQLGELEPAYAITVHKSQGSEYRAVVLALWGGHPNLLSRSVLYTAVTRARELLVGVGREQTVAAMVENAHRGRRYSGLKLRLQGKTGPENC